METSQPHFYQLKSGRETSPTAGLSFVLKTSTNDICTGSVDTAMAYGDLVCYAETGLITLNVSL